MTQRLIRALQGGGITVRTGADVWGVWRGRDRRRRKIGTLSGAEIEVLRMREDLSQLGDDSNTLIWTGPVSQSAPTGSSAVLLADAGSSLDGPFLDWVIARCKDRTLRQTMRETVQTYRWDLMASLQQGKTHGMNWRGMALGGRIQGDVLQLDHHAPQVEALKAARRIKRVHAALSKDQRTFLDQLVLREEKRSQLLKRYRIRASLLEARATALLRLLADTYAALTEKGG